MLKVFEKDYKSFIAPAERAACGRVYPLSIACGIQPGDIFFEGDAAFFWHHCGFGHIAGSPSEGMLRDIRALMASPERPRRLVLITEDARAISYFRHEGAEISERVFYAWGPGDAPHAPPVPEGFRIERIGPEHMGRFTGRIVPSFSWDCAESFLEKGFGFAAVSQGDICAVAFSAAVSPFEIDIGVQTREGYRGRGLAAALAWRMCLEISRRGKAPVWAHAAGNTGSMRTALKCGFVPCGTAKVIRLRENG
ncbi:MAG: GNAT family N-acetyltransferase [Clostridia bacterium]|nr:GNAT family N-acetyltransferase [Clostridia bacterium]